MEFLEGIGNVLEEDEAEHDVLVLGGVHVPAELVGGSPELLLEAEICPVARSPSFGFLLLRHASVATSGVNTPCEFKSKP